MENSCLKYSRIVPCTSKLAKSASSALYIQAKKELAEYYKQELERKAAAAARFRSKDKVPEKKKLSIKEKAIKLNERIVETKQTMEKISTKEYWGQKQRDIKHFRFDEWKHERRKNLRKKRKEKEKNQSIYAFGIFRQKLNSSNFMVHIYFFLC